MKDKDPIDLYKLLLSIGICFLHSVVQLGEQNDFYPWVRIMVPLFFVYSSYFFFVKWEGDASIKQTYFPFFKRQCILYLVWAGILAPFWISSVKIHRATITKDMVVLIWKFFFQGIFPVAWFIIALVIGVFIVCILSKAFNNRNIFLLCLIPYTVCVLSYAYRGIFPKDSLFLRVAINGYPGSLNLSFFVGLVYIAMGKIIAENSFTGLSNSRLTALLIASLLCLYLEHTFLIRLGLMATDEALFSLVPVTFIIALLSLRSDFTVKHAKLYRKISTINYCLHYNVVYMIFKTMHTTFANMTLLVISVFAFFITELLVFLFSLIVISLEKKCKILKYLH